MKNTIAYYLLLIYLFALCRPVMPLLQDAIAHSFYEQEHIATVHLLNGSHHAEKEAGSLAKETTKNNAGAKARCYENVSVHVAAAFQLKFSHAICPQTASAGHLYYFFPSIAIAIQLPPPRV